VNLFIPSELNWREKNIFIRQETTFPGEPGTTLLIKGNGKFTLKIRRPSWAGEGFSVKINDVKRSITAIPGSYLTLDRNWKDNDRISITLPLEFRVEYTPDVKDVGGIMYGPVLLCGENVNDLPILNFDSSNPDEAFSRDNDDPLHFKSNGISFVPFYQIHGLPYSVYFKID